MNWDMLIYLSPAVGVGIFVLIVGSIFRLSGRISEREREEEDLETHLAAHLEHELSSAA